MEHIRIFRSNHDRIIAGVCGGMGIYFKVDPLIFRALFVLLALSGGTGIILYIFLALFLPREAGAPDETRGGEPADIADRARDLAAELKAHYGSGERHRTTLGLALLVLGALFLANQLFPDRIQWHLLAPLALIALGLLLLVQQPRP